MCTVDPELSYIPFAQDRGPYNIAQTLKGCTLIHELLTVSEVSIIRARCSGWLTKSQAKRYAGKPICLYSCKDPAFKTNMILMACLYTVSQLQSLGER